MTKKTRVYRMESSQRAVSIILLAIGLVFTIAAWSGVLSGNREPRFLELLSPLAFSLVAAFFTIRAFRNSIVLSASSVEKRSLSGTRTLLLDKIKGRRRYLSEGDGESPDVWHLVIESDDDRFPKLDIEELYNFDEFFYAWFRSLPDLDERDKTQPKTSNFGLV